MVSCCAPDGSPRLLRRIVTVLAQLRIVGDPSPPLEAILDGGARSRRRTPTDMSIGVADMFIGVSRRRDKVDDPADHKTRTLQRVRGQVVTPTVGDVIVGGAE